MSNLSKKGFQIGTVKHIHHGDFTIDAPGKDTWRHAQAGAGTVIAVSTNEVAIIRKTKDLQEDLNSILNLFDTNLDLIFLEGLHTLILQRSDVYKIITASTVSDAKLRLSDMCPPILAESFGGIIILTIDTHHFLYQFGVEMPTSCLRQSIK